MATATQAEQSFRDSINNLINATHNAASITSSGNLVDIALLNKLTPQGKIVEGNAKIVPNNSDEWSTKAKSYAESNNWPQALQAYKKAMMLRPKCRPL